MDPIRTKIGYLDRQIFNLLFRLITATIIYFFVFKKLIVYFFNVIFLPFFTSLNDKNSEINFQLIGDDLFITSLIENIDRVIINLPFSAYYFFFISLIYPKIFRFDARYVHSYNLALFIIQPLFIYLIINGFSWADNLIRVHEIGYKISFLALGMYIFSNDQKNKSN